MHNEDKLSTLKIFEKLLNTYLETLNSKIIINNDDLISEINISLKKYKKLPIEELPIEELPSEELTSEELPTLIDTSPANHFNLNKQCIKLLNIIKNPLHGTADHLYQTVIYQIIFKKRIEFIENLINEIETQDNNQLVTILDIILNDDDILTFIRFDLSEFIHKYLNVDTDILNNDQMIKNLKLIFRQFTKKCIYLFFIKNSSLEEINENKDIKLNFKQNDQTMREFIKSLIRDVYHIELKDTDKMMLNFDDEILNRYKKIFSLFLLNIKKILINYINFNRNQMNFLKIGTLFLIKKLELTD